MTAWAYRGTESRARGVTRHGCRPEPVAKVLADGGVDALRFVQEGAVAGEVFAFGISEAGNDLVLFGSDTDAAPRPDGSYAFTGTKIFTSLAPVWTQLGLHGLDTTSGD